MNPKNIRIENFDYPLPDDRIAKHPLALRDKCKLLVRHPDASLEERVFDQLPDILPEDSLLIYNNTRVINARLRFRKGIDNSGAIIEIFCLEPHLPSDYEQNFASNSSCSWQCIVGNSKRWKDDPLSLDLNINGVKTSLTAYREKKDGNISIVNFSWNNNEITFSQIISAAGEIPIPPYLNRNSEESDKDDYQTVFSRIEGSVAAPTAGLHFTPELLDNIDKKGIIRRELTLHVGAGTFQPVKSDTIGEHTMHSEFIAVKKSLIEEIANTSRTIIAVGTTSVRTLESLYHIGKRILKGLSPNEVTQWEAYEDTENEPSVKCALNAIIDYLNSTSEESLIASTRIIIAPSYSYKVVNGIITNFHQPQSTLLLLVSAFVGGNWREIYDFALNNNFRFLSYGDACLLLSPSK